MRIAHRAAFRGTLVLASLLPAASAVAQRYTFGGQDLSVYNLVGSIRVQGGAGADIVVNVTRRGPDASKLTVESGRLRGRDALRVIYPAERVVFRDGGSRWERTRLYVNKDGTFGDDGERRMRFGFGDGRIEIASSGRGLDAAADVAVSLPPGRSLTINLAAGKATLENVDGDLRVNVWAADVTTTGTRGRLELDTGSGDVRVSDAEGELTLDSGSGGVTLAGVKGPSLTIDSGSGRVQADAVLVDRLDIDSGSGAIDLRSVQAPDITLDSGSGSVRLDLKADVNRMSIDAGSGDVTIHVPESLGAELEASTASGGVEFDFPVQLLRKANDFVRARIGDGQGRISIDAGSGAIRLRRS
ncbi:MAG: hypothetical protein MNPFHGCM_02009 [Gemmatimonadaceae bacterium]|nr:hypothetical protein [Gemmatimonadaceae bacterium]